MKVANCRSCDAPIIWAETAANGKRMPVDADPLPTDRAFRLVGFGGRDIDEIDEQETPIAVFVAMRAPDERLYVSHFSTCPHANAHRRTA